MTSSVPAARYRYRLQNNGPLQTPIRAPQGGKTRQTCRGSAVPTVPKCSSDPADQAICQPLLRCVPAVRRPRRKRVPLPPTRREVRAGVSSRRFAGKYAQHQAHSICSARYGGLCDFPACRPKLTQHGKKRASEAFYPRRTEITHPVQIRQGGGPRLGDTAQRSGGQAHWFAGPVGPAHELQTEPRQPVINVARRPPARRSRAGCMPSASPWITVRNAVPIAFPASSRQRGDARHLVQRRGGARPSRSGCGR